MTTIETIIRSEDDIRAFVQRLGIETCDRTETYELIRNLSYEEQFDTCLNGEIVRVTSLRYTIQVKPQRVVIVTNGRLITTSPELELALRVIFYF